VVEETVGYLLAAPMRLPEGAWASSEDADSEGAEGRFYTWSLAEVDEVGGPVASAWYAASEAGNWEGKNILWRPRLGDLARSEQVERAREALLARRARRPRPGLDAKVVTEWNAMAVAALAVAGTALDRPAWVAAASETAEFLLGNLRRSDGRWLRSWLPAQGQARHLACSADYAWLVHSFTRLGEATGRSTWTSAACETAASLMELFWDAEAGAFFTYGSDAEQLIARMKDIYDGAVPSANATAALALARLGELTGQERYSKAAQAVLKAMAPALSRAPAAFCGSVLAATYLAFPRRQVVVASTGTELPREAWQRYLPDTVLAWGEPYGSRLWEGREGPAAAGQAFVCEGYSCELPVSTPAELGALLDSPHPELGQQGPR
jgi:uncharacterized protein YyaL (SSP411 family)